MGARTSQVEHCLSCRRIVALSSIIAAIWKQRRLEICTSCNHKFCRVTRAWRVTRGTGRAGPHGSVSHHQLVILQEYDQIGEILSWISPVSIHALSTTHSTSLVPPSANPSQIRLSIPTDLRSLRFHKLACAPICLYGTERKELE